MEANKKTIFEKIQNVRVGLLEEQIKKSGKLGGKDKPYMELADFLNPINKLMKQERMTAIITFEAERAVLTAHDFDAVDGYSISCPIAAVNTPGCNAMQGLGAVQTYVRRYLYMALFDIAETDIIENNTGKNDGQQKHKAVKKPTAEQIDEAQNLNIDLNRLAAYLKCNVEDVGSDKLQEAITQKQKALADKKAKSAEPTPPAEEQA